jgi:hypothetical protein
MGLPGSCPFAVLSWRMHLIRDQHEGGREHPKPFQGPDLVYSFLLLDSPFGKGTCDLIPLGFLMDENEQIGTDDPV